MKDENGFVSMSTENPYETVRKVGSAVDHPSHYNTGRIEVIDFIEDQKLSFHLGNAVKYICRAGRKDPLKKREDIEKAIWYLERHLLLMDREQEER